jgi:hypothetical protein
MNCIWCGSPNLRNSRMRISDLSRLPLLQFPVRCLSCEERYFAGPLCAWRLHAAAKARRIERRRRQPPAPRPN